MPVVILVAEGDKWSLLNKPISGLHTPFAYETAREFGAAFACHTDDLRVNGVHVGPVGCGYCRSTM